MNLRQQMETLCTCLCRQTELYRIWARQHGMSYNTMMTLYALKQDRRCSQKQIAEEWMIPKQTVNTVVKDLERRGSVRFAPGRDQKEKRVCFTEQGKAYAEAALEELCRMEDRALERMGPELCRQLVDSNLAFAAALESEVRCG